MSYAGHEWRDRIVEYPNRFLVTEVGDGVVDLERVTGTVTDAGTTITAEKLNEMEEGIMSKADDIHTHAAEDIVGALPIEKGGTGATTRVEALTALTAFGYRGALSNIDMDTVTSPGSYQVASTSAGTIANGAFTSGAYHVYVRCGDSSGSRIVQEATPTSSSHSSWGKIKYRVLYISNGTVQYKTDWEFYAREGGSIASAEKLKTGRKVRVDLTSGAQATFDGTANITPGVTGALPIANGGTGATNAADALNNLGAEPKSTSSTMTVPTVLQKTSGGPDLNTSDYGVVKHIGRRYEGYFNIETFTSSASGITTVANFKSGYRPTVNSPVSGRVEVSSGIYAPITGYVHTNGNVMLIAPAISTAYLSAMIFFNFYNG